MLQPAARGEKALKPLIALKMQIYCSPVFCHLNFCRARLQRSVGRTGRTLFCRTLTLLGGQQVPHLKFEALSYITQNCGKRSSIHIHQSELDPDLFVPSLGLEKRPPESEAG
jgi:hypothetical protein